MKIVLVRENEKVRVLEGEGTIDSTLLAMRSRLTSGDVRYYEFDYDETIGLPLEAYIASLNMFPDILDSCIHIKEITMLNE